MKSLKEKTKQQESYTFVPVIMTEEGENFVAIPIIESHVSISKAEALAQKELKKKATAFKIRKDLSQLRLDKVKESILGKHVLYQQYHQDKPITGAWVRVDIDNEGKVYNILNDLVPADLIQQSELLQANKSKSIEMDIGARVITSEEVKSMAAKEISPSVEAHDYDKTEPEPVYFQLKGTPPILAWKVMIKGEKPAVEMLIYFDAHSGKVLDKSNLLKYINGAGRVFDPHPVAALNNTSLKHNSVIPPAAYKDVDLLDLHGNGMLDGPFVNTSTTTGRVVQSNAQFLFDRNARAFKEVMVYFHIDTIQRHVQQLGFSNVLNSSIPANIDGTSDDQSFYSPLTKSLTFGTGGVDDAEDAEIIIHEYGHAILDNQIPGFGKSKEAKAIGEGFGDYLAASCFSDNKPSSLQSTIGNWDAVFYSNANPPCLRRLDSNKLYPRDITGEEHDDGEIWSACLWEIRILLGRKDADKLIIAHHFLLSHSSGFVDAANAIITVDKQLNKGNNKAALRNIFKRRGILP
jgi:Zn-dependent metalloprotease